MILSVSLTSFFSPFSLFFVSLWFYPVAEGDPIYPVPFLSSAPLRLSASALSTRKVSEL
jgi:hypothetical protein